MNIQHIAFAVFVTISGPCLANDGLGTAWTDVRGSMFLAATRANVAPPKNVMQCIDDYDQSCRWDAGDGVDVLANTDGAGHLTQIEASWNNAKRSTTHSSAVTFRNLCATIAGLANPKWGKAEIAKAVGKTMILRSSTRDSVDAEQSLPGLKLYGSRNTPAPGMRDRPDEAFLQCGAVAE